jgi:hypothetical protein
VSGNPIPLTLDQPIRFDQPLDLNDAREALRAVSEARRDARDWLRRALLNAAEKERDYRKGRAIAWVSTDGTAKEREDKVNDKTAEARAQRDIALGVVKVAQERIEEVDGDARALYRLIEWSMRLNPTAQPDEPDGPVRTFGGWRAA